jgi:nitroimidazol reductase NimA-like FMN-containing flavoprotein (pyridoxamine 5'-phosphate oxidase superfamily)
VAEIGELSAEECQALLRAGVFGRMVVLAPERAEIVPVNYVATEDAVLVQTARGSLLDTCADGTQLLFEIDHVNYERWHGWSVVVRGVGERVREDQLTERERRAPGPPRWVTREDESWIRLRWTSISGRRVGSGWDPLAELPVRRVW